MRKEIIRGRLNIEPKGWLFSNTSFFNEELLIRTLGEICRDGKVLSGTSAKAN